MAQQSFCDEQIQRLHAFPRFRTEDVVAKEYADALAGACGSNEAARRVIDDVIECCVDVPTVADILRMARERSPAPERTTSRCSTCRDSGYVSSTWLVDFDQFGHKTRRRLDRKQLDDFRAHPERLKTNVQGIYEAAEPCCDCAAGQAIAAGAPAKTVKRQSAPTRAGALLPLGKGA